MKTEDETETHAESELETEVDERGFQQKGGGAKGIGRDVEEVISILVSAQWCSQKCTWCRRGGRLLFLR